MNFLTASVLSVLLVSFSHPLHAGAQGASFRPEESPVQKSPLHSSPNFKFRPVLIKEDTVLSDAVPTQPASPETSQLKREETVLEGAVPTQPASPLTPDENQPNQGSNPIRL